MPSERSSASAITGLNALRTNARSISLQTCIRPFCNTERVTGSSAMASIVVEDAFALGAVGRDRARCGRGRRVADFLHVPRAWPERPALLLYFRKSATRHPRPDRGARTHGVACRSMRDRDGRAPCFAEVKE